jgi:hypothetical protein
VTSTLSYQGGLDFDLTDTAYMQPFECVYMDTGSQTNSQKLIVYDRHWQPIAHVPSVAHGMIFNGTLSELKHSNYDLIKNL